MNEPRVIESVTNECQSLGRAHESSSARAEQLIACLEGEIAKRGARIAEMQERFDSSAHRTSLIGRLEIENDQLRAELAAIKAQEPIAWYTEDHLDDKSATTYSWTVAERWVEKGWPVSPLYAAPVSEAKAQGVVMPDGWIPLTIEHEPGYPEDVAFGPKRMMDRLKKWLDRYFEMRLNAAPVQKASVPDDFVCDSKPLQELLNATAMLLETPCPDSATYWAAQLANVEQLLAAPSAPAADAGIVDMYRHLQKVTPYRFKKIQDASITDGGDVLYFHEDRFDAALLDDMAAHRAKGVV